MILFTFKTTWQVNTSFLVAHGTGCVFAARRKTTGEIVAVKAGAVGQSGEKQPLEVKPVSHLRCFLILA